MNILILPHNMASMPSMTAEALNKIEGITAKCLILDRHKYQSTYPGTVYIPLFYTKRKPLQWLWHKLTYKRRIYKLLKWADVLHYHWGAVFQNNEDIKWVAESGKPLFVEWVGSEVRIPDICKKINPYYARIFDHGYEYNKMESREKSLKLQETFCQAGAIPLIIPEMNIYIQKELFKSTYPSFLRLEVKKFQPVFPAVNNSWPIIVHSPTAKICKGTDLIIEVLNELKSFYNFEFVLLHDMTRDQVLEVMSKADIFLDQINLGSHGAATMEAMAMGKPAMCYIMKEVFEGGLPAECPVVNTNPDNLKEQLIRLLSDAQLRHDIGKQSRAFAEDYFDIDKIALYLKDTYQTAYMAKKKENA